MKTRFADGRVPEKNRSARKMVAAELKTARLSKKLTQQELADMTGTQKSNICRMESGSYNPSLDFLVKVANSLDRELKVTLE
ncbi:MAG: helix-turn-helix domain-containing protein [Lachnospiraceae bacterium]|nr:helix-turn-helix domain-containing protein [Lachnospiraceae bacterium]